MRDKPFFSCRIRKNERDGGKSSGGKWREIFTSGNFAFVWCQTAMFVYEHAKHFIPADFGSENLRICFAIIESYVLLDEKEFLQVRYEFKT